MKIHRIQCKAWSQAGYNGGGALKGFQRHHLVNALLVATTLKFVVQKGVNDLAGKAGAHNAAARHRYWRLLWARVYSALNASEQQQARMPLILLAHIDMPTPVPQHRMAKSLLPLVTAPQVAAA